VEQQDNVESSWASRPQTADGQYIQATQGQEMSCNSLLTHPLLRIQVKEGRIDGDGHWHIGIKKLKEGTETEKS
jgi:hypothetical protein